MKLKKLKYVSLELVLTSPSFESLEEYIHIGGFGNVLTVHETRLHRASRPLDYAARKEILFVNKNLQITKSPKGKNPFEIALGMTLTIRFKTWSQVQRYLSERK